MENEVVFAISEVVELYIIGWQKSFYVLCVVLISLSKMLHARAIIPLAFKSRRENAAYAAFCKNALQVEILLENTDALQ